MMSNVINVAEHDYATYIISNAMQADDGGEGESQIVYQVQEFLQDDNVEGVAVDDIAFEGASYQFITTEGGDELEGANRPRYRREVSMGSSGYWNEDDVNRLLKVYLKHVRKQPRLRGKPNLVTWNDILREFDTRKKFTKAQIKTKMLRLKNIGRKILKHGVSDRTPWPFWKSVREILVLEDRNGLPDKSTGKERWTNNDLLALLDSYEMNMESMVEAGANENERREVWDKIAAELGRPQHEVRTQYKKLKARYERWQETWNPRHPLEKVFRRLQDIMAEKMMAADPLQTAARETETTAGRISFDRFRGKWGREETTRLLDVYLELLREMHSTKQVKTRSAIYKLVGKRMNIHVHAIQVKLTSLKGHFKKHLNFTEHSATTRWRYADAMEKIMRYENAIWTQLDTTSNLGELAEPEWFRKYRTDVETRHNETISVLDKLLSVMQRILES